MPDDILPFDETRDTSLSRRTFATSFGVSAIVTASAMAADRTVVETDAIIKMTDGNCDAALFHPSGGGSWPGTVLALMAVSASHSVDAVREKHTREDADRLLHANALAKVLDFDMHALFQLCRP